MSERGDKGMTEGECFLNVSKDSPFAEAVGTIDKFGGKLGWTRVMLEDQQENQRFYQIEEDLIEVMGSLYTGQNWINGEKRIKEVDNDVDLYKKRVENLAGFLIPGQNELESRINICRTECREAERRVVTLKLDREEKEDLEMDGNILKYFNRLSTFLYWMWRSKRD